MKDHVWLVIEVANSDLIIEVFESKKEAFEYAFTDPMEPDYTLQKKEVIRPDMEAE